MSEMIERHARAYDPVGWNWYDNAVDYHPAKAVFRERAMKQSRAAISALKYADGIDEDRLIRASNSVQLDAVRGAEFWDAMLDEALK